MARYEYMRIPLQIIPAEIIDQYAIKLNGTHLVHYTCHRTAENHFW
jgi:hypothetical protein